jgi:predicted ATPase
MISNLSVQNFKSLRHIHIDLQQFTIFVGANGSGKSSILQSLNLICQSFRSDGNSEKQAMHQGMSSGAEGAVELQIESDSAGYRLRASKTDQNVNRANNQPWNGIGCGFTPEVASNVWKPWKPDAPGLVMPPQSILLRLEYSNLIQATAGQDPLKMGANGSGLHSALANMALNDPDSWQQLQVDLKRIIPMIRRLRHTPAAGNQPSALLFDTIGANGLRAHQVSEGTLLVLALLALFYGPDRPNLILLDDMDRGLHPKAQRDLILLVRGLLETNPSLQLLASTHSPYMLDSVEAAEVRITYLQPETGSTICAPLAQHPKFQKWKDEMHPGELWSLFGETWVAEQKVVDAAVVNQGEGA